jgi:phosphoserine phosphatase
VPNTSTTLAVVFDFDDTLVPDSTTLFLKEHGIDTDKFWKQDLTALVQSGYDPTLGFLKLFLDNVGHGKPFGRLTNAALRAWGKKLDKRLFPGLRQLIPDLRAEADRFDARVEFYVVSGGLEEIIKGCSFVADNFKAIYGCRLAENGSPAMVTSVQRAITFTEKTRYLFEICKGIKPDESVANPYLVNSYVAPEKRRIPFENMMYIGDGLTDIPCFSLLGRSGGTVFGVFDPKREASAKRAFLEFLQPGRVQNMSSAKYGRTDDLGSLLRVSFSNRCTSIVVDRGQAKHISAPPPPASKARPKRRRKSAARKKPRP